MGHIIILRGNSGAGKSFTAHRFLDSYPSEEIEEDGWNKTKPKLIGYRLPDDMFLLGPYRAAGGGLDLISPDDRSRYKDLISRYAAQGHVFAESLVLTNMYGWLAGFAKEVGFDNITVVTLDTLPEDSVANIYTRNGGKAIKEASVFQNYKNVLRGTKMLAENGVPIIMTDRFHALDVIKGVFAQHGWDPDGTAESTVWI